MSLNSSHGSTSMTVPQLKMELRQRGLDLNGTKSELVQRLDEAIQNQSGSNHLPINDATPTKMWDSSNEGPLSPRSKRAIRRAKERDATLASLDDRNLTNSSISNTFDSAISDMNTLLNASCNNDASQSMKNISGDRPTVEAASISRPLPVTLYDEVKKASARKRPVTPAKIRRETSPSGIVRKTSTPATAKKASEVPVEQEQDYSGSKLVQKQDDKPNESEQKGEGDTTNEDNPPQLSSVTASTKQSSPLKSKSPTRPRDEGGRLKVNPPSDGDTTENKHLDPSSNSSQPAKASLSSWHRSQAKACLVPPSPTRIFLLLLSLGIILSLIATKLCPTPWTQPYWDQLDSYSSKFYHCMEQILPPSFLSNLSQMRLDLFTFCRHLRLRVAL